MSFEFVDDHREYLQREFKMRLLRNPRYSQRAFARDLGLSASSLNDYLRNKLKFSPARLTQISNQLGLHSKQIEHWSDLCEIKFNKSALQKKLVKTRVQQRLNDERKNISVDQFKVISEWHYMAILELLQINPAVYSDPARLAADLSLPLSKMKKSLKLLAELQMISLETNGHYKVCEVTFVQNSVPSVAVRQYHYQILGKAQQALDTQGMDKRFNSSIMLGIPEEQIPAIMQEINQMAMKVLEPYAKLGPESKNVKLYCLGLQFFSLTNPEEK